MVNGKGPYQCKTCCGASRVFDGSSAASGNASSTALKLPRSQTCFPGELMNNR